MALDHFGSRHFSDLNHFASASIAGVSTGFNVRTYDPTGGLFTNGNALTHPSFAYTYGPDGGILFGGEGFTYKVRRSDYVGGGQINLADTAPYNWIKEFRTDIQRGVRIFGQSFNITKTKNYDGTGQVNLTFNNLFNRVKVPVQPTGGIVTSGSAIDNRVFADTGEGGVQLGFEAFVSKTLSALGTGGIQTGGTSSGVKEQVYAGTGTVTTSGTSPYNQAKNYQTITTTIDLTGAATLVKRKVPVVGLVPITFGGEVIGDKIKYNIPSGGAVLSGSSYNVKLFHLFTSGGATMGGIGGTGYRIARTYSTVLTPIITSGVADKSKIKVISPIGGVVTSGIATLESLKFYVPTSGVNVFGIALINKEKYYTASGGVDLAGGEGISLIKNWVPSGLILTSGSATIEKLKQYNATGGVVIDIASEWLKIKYYDADGLVTLGGFGSTHAVGPRDVIYIKTEVHREDRFLDVSKYSAQARISTKSTATTKVEVSKYAFAKISKETSTQTLAKPVASAKTEFVAAKKETAAKPTKQVTITRRTNKVKI